jgi:hypothetical protein
VTQVWTLVGVLVVGLLFWVGVGCAIALVRIVLPGLAGAADRSLAALSTSRLVVSGVLPIVGALLVTWAIAEAKVLPAVALLVWIPLCLLFFAGATAALPRIGERLAKAGGDLSLVRRCVAGALAVGFASLTWLFWPLGLLVTLLLAGWILGAGLGLLAGRAVDRPGPG